MFKFFKKKDNAKNYIDNRLYMTCVYNQPHNTITIISIGEEYLDEAIEFLQAVSSTTLTYEYIISGDQKDVQDNKNDDITIKPEEYYKDRYIILSGTAKAYLDIYNYINSVSNYILNELLNKIIYKYFSSTNAVKLYDYGIIQFNNFKYKKRTPEYFGDTISLPNSNVIIDDYKYIKRNLPNAINRRSLLKFIKISYNNEVIYSLYDYLFKIDDPDISFRLLPYVNIYPKINTKAEMKELLMQPIFTEEEDDDRTGYEDNELDELFRKQYDSFTGLYDEEIEFKEIDEIANESDIDDDYVRNYTKEHKQ